MLCAVFFPNYQNHGQTDELISLGGFMTTSSPADGSANSKSIAWYASIPGLAKFCGECAASRKRMAAAIQKAESATSTPKAEEVSSSTHEESTVSGIESNASQIPQSPSTAANQTSIPAEAASVDKGSSNQKKLLIFLGIAALVIVLAYIGWFSAHK
jgi:hypothetical protein